MKFFDWLKGQISPKHRATVVYRRGMLRAKAQRPEAAIADYTAALDMEGAPASVRAMSLYNRALVHSSLGNEMAARRDLERVLEMPGAAESIKTEARRKLVRMARNSDRAETNERTSETHGSPSRPAPNVQNASGKRAK